MRKLVYWIITLIGVAYTLSMMMIIMVKGTRSPPPQHRLRP